MAGENETAAQMIREESALLRHQKWCAAFIAAQGELVNPLASALNNGIGRGVKYCDLATLLDCVRPVLAKHGLGFTQTARIDFGPPGDGSEAVARVAVDTSVFHKDGHTEHFRGPALPAIGRDGRVTAHSIGGATTYGRRYGLGAICGIFGEVDDDGNDISNVGRGSGITEIKWSEEEKS